METATYSASGKLLLFGEYLVLRGAKSLAIPLAPGQKLTVSPISEKGVLWQCFELGKEWLKIRFSEGLEVLETTDGEKSLLIQKLLLLIKAQQPELKTGGLYFKFDLDFNRRFGFGSSATLISLLSQWSKVNPYFLLEHSLGGSGYDIPTATAQKPVLYTIAQKQIKSVTLDESIGRHLLLVYTGQKQKSTSAVATFNKKPVSYAQITTMNAIVEAATKSKDITEWENLMERSETLLSAILKRPPVQQQHFKDYPHAIKSLGAWGGDFMMASFRDISQARAYFQQKNNDPVYTYHELIK